MKKSFLCFLIVSALFLTTACGNKSDNDEKEDSKSKTETLTCTSSETDEDGLKTEDTAVIKYNSKDNKVISIEETAITEVDANFMTFTFNMLDALAKKFDEIDGISIKVSKENDTTIKSVTSIMYDKINVDSIKSALEDMFDEDALFSKKDVTIDDLKNETFKDYTCK